MTASQEKHHVREEDQIHEESRRCEVSQARGEEDRCTLEQKNGVALPAEGTLCRAIWDALDKLAAKGDEATFTTAKELLKDEKMADATIRIQEQRGEHSMGKTDT